MNSNNCAHPGTSLGRSVVPDLMKVYESLTQSSTPQESDINSQNSQRSHTSSHPQDAENYSTNINNPTQPTHPHHHHLHQHHEGAQNLSSQPHYNNASRNSPVPPNAHTFQHNNQPPNMIRNSHAQNFTSSESNKNSQDSSNLAKKAPPAPIPPPPPPTNTSTSATTSGTTGNQKILSSDTQQVASTSTAITSTKSRKKVGGSDGRWSKRFTWPDELHRDFVSAIFDVGLKHSSPSTILEHMKKHPDATAERVKSHLQKYRLHRQKSKTEFMSCYDSTLVKIKSGVMDTVDVNNMSSAEIAAHLSHTSLNEPKDSSTDDQLTNPSAKHSIASSKDAVLQLPQLTDAEKQSPLGASMGYLMGLFFALRQQLMYQRAASSASNPSVANTNDSYFFQSNIPPPPANIVPHFKSDTPPPQHCTNQIVNITYAPTLESPEPISRPNVNNTNDKYRQHMAVYQAPHDPGNYGPIVQVNQEKSVVQNHYTRWEVTPTPHSNSIPAPDPQNYILHRDYPREEMNHPIQQKISPRPSPQEVVIPSHDPHPTSAHNTTTQIHVQNVDYKDKDCVDDSPRNDSPTEFPPEVRNKIEESNQMKREMQSQKAFQNKLRALKRKEISKCTSHHGGIEFDNHNLSDPADFYDYSIDHNLNQPKESNTGRRNKDDIQSNVPPPQTKRSRTESLGTADDYWSSDMMDDHLFQFLINTDGDT